MPKRFGFNINKNGGGQSRLEGTALPTSGTKSGTYTVTDSGGNSATGNVHMNITAKPAAPISLFSVDVPQSVPAGEQVNIPITLHVVSTEPHYYFRIVPQENFYTSSFPQEGLYFIHGGAPEEPCTVSLRVECIRVSWETGEISDVLEAQDITFDVVKKVVVLPTIDLAASKSVYEFQEISWHITTTNGTLKYYEVYAKNSSDQQIIANSLRIKDDYWIVGFFDQTYNGEIVVSGFHEDTGQYVSKTISLTVSRPPAATIVESGHIMTSYGVSSTVGVTMPRYNSWGSRIYALVFAAGRDVTQDDTRYAQFEDGARAKDLGWWGYNIDSGNKPTDEETLAITLKNPSVNGAIKITGFYEKAQSASYIENGFSNGSREFVGHYGEQLNHIGVALVWYPGSIGASL